MKRALPWLAVVLASLWLAASWRLPKPPSDDFDTRVFGRLPVVVGGRLKPLDTVARNSLMIMRGKQSLRLETGKMSAIRWLGDVFFDEAKADKHPSFVVTNPDLFGMFGWPHADKKYCSYDEFRPHLAKINSEAGAAAKLKPGERTPFQAAVFNLRNSIYLYQQLKRAVQPEGSANFAAEVDAYAAAVRGNAEAKASGGKDEDKERLGLLTKSRIRYEMMAEGAYVLAVPPAGTDGPAEDWQGMARALLAAGPDGSLSPAVRAYAVMGDAWRAGDREGFAKIAAQYAGAMNTAQPRASGRAAYELFFNQAEPFYHCMILYVLTGLLVAGYWLGGWQSFRHTAIAVLLLAFAVHSFGMCSRMWLQERPPVTNLYSSAVFVGWGAVMLGLILERVYRIGVGAACSAVVGFVTLIIAHHLAGSGDTMEMLVAVLDTNIWLATHVVVITYGYSAMFLAGFLAVAYVLVGLFTPWLNRSLATALERMVYGIICFATLFSFLGTVLGGIWADQSWGRFWGWDPKENGALLIVLWCAVILHARWGGYIGQRGLMACALVGNAITAFSWFGVNMLGVGLHSYGFMDKAFPWLVGFVVAQGVLIAVTRVPARYWLSFRGQTEA